MQNFKNKLLPIFITAIFCIPFISIYAEEIIADPIIDPITTPDPVVDPDPVVEPEAEIDPSPVPDPDPIIIPDPVVDPNTNTQTPPPPVLQENFIIRINDTVLFNGTVDLPASGSVSILDSNNVAHDVNSQSVLAVLKSIDDANDSFAISNLTYYDSFGSFYLKCITPLSGTEQCDNWQYAVGATTPFSSIDTTILTGGETIGIYFGSSHRISIDKNSVTSGESIIASAEKYDYQNNIWGSLTGVSIGITLPNPNDPWSPTVVATYPVDVQGLANIPLTVANTYTIGIVEDYYFPSYSVVVSEPQAGCTSNCGGNSTTTSFSIPNAVTYLESTQSPDGSFGGSELYTDWAAIALASYNIKSSVKKNILGYLKSNNKTSSNLTDNERRAMTLLALGQNPYDFDGTNYIQTIVKSFDGTQFGDMNLINDDIFAIIPLYKSGYSTSDEIITKDISYIISKQKSNGSWEDSVDMTSAGIQALSLYNNAPGVSNSINLASSYLKSMQQSDGGFGNVSSTAWAMQASSAIGENWGVGGKNGLDYLAMNQISDGGLLSMTESLQNRVWNTSYAIPGALGKTWVSVMQSVNKEKVEDISDKNQSDKIEDEEAEEIKNPTIEEIKNIVVEDKKEIVKAEIRKVKIEKVAKAEIPVEPQDQTLTANSFDAKNKIPTPYILGGMVLITGLLLLKNFYKKV
jgi:hypothetical protein